MDQYITGTMIKKLREEKNLTQSALADKLGVSDKAVSKWETGRGLPDITLVEPIAEALGVSVIELLSGVNVTNKNRASNMLRSKLYVCPVCGNVIYSVGGSVVSCCGITLPPLDAEEPDEAHRLSVEVVEDEYYVTMEHEMTKEHFISFLAAFYDDAVQIVKLYPEGMCEARFKIGRLHSLYCYCNRHGLYKLRRSGFFK